jgi:hypothetical protein
MACGAKVELPCASCGAGNPPAAKFYRKCGQPLRVSGVGSQRLSAAQASIEATGAKSYAPFVHVERAALAGLLGDVQKREPSYAKRTSCSPPWAPQGMRNGWRER